eukprot:GHVU01112299.1.p1 GENE.GHVU01112299.1~~GHVU01112299.1.p1  ORF type:complete len:537 (+),score=43.10 GHVU01112299.1:265-1875(+)
MERIRRSFRRKKKDHVPESSKPHQWQEDERKVREGTCSFQVRYLGTIEVFESRGMQVCEEAVKALKAQCKGKYQRAVLYVSGDALRVVDEISKGLVVDQTIEKVSFCAPDRNHEKGFAYICRDGTTRRWMCHGFLAVKESVSGERLSHAVGCAFAICLERKQKRDKESGVTVTYNDKGTSFTRMGSFRQTTLTERLADPQSAIIADTVPEMAAENPYAVERPHATDLMIQRQTSFRGFQKLAESSPFKRQLSLRLNELPSTLERQQQLGKENGGLTSNGPVSPIPEASPTKENPDSISNMCQQLTQGLSALASEDPFAKAPQSNAVSSATASAVPTTQTPASSVFNRATQPNIPLAQPIKQTNPWSTPPQQPAVSSKVSDADFWLQSTASSVVSTNPFTTPESAVNGGVQNDSYTSQAVAAGVQQQYPGMGMSPQLAAFHRAPHLAHLRSHSLDTTATNPTLQDLSNRDHVNQFQSQQNGVTANPWTSFDEVPKNSTTDPFDAAWNSKTPNKSGTTVARNPFQAGDSIVKTFEVKL